jgi:hypothetical protein
VVNHSRYVSGRKVILAIGIVLLVFGIVIADRIVYFRKLSWLGATMKGIAAVYFGCDKTVELTQPMTGDWLIQYCSSKVSEDFVQAAKDVTVFSRGCLDKSVVAWGPELHFWAENWMPFAPKPGRFVLFENKKWSFVTTGELAKLGCP